MRKIVLALIGMVLGIGCGSTGRSGLKASKLEFTESQKLTKSGLPINFSKLTAPENSYITYDFTVSRSAEYDGSFGPGLSSASRGSGSSKPKLKPLKEVNSNVSNGTYSVEIIEGKQKGQPASWGLGNSKSKTNRRNDVVDSNGRIDSSGVLEFSNLTFAGFFRFPERSLVIGSEWEESIKKHSI